MRCRCEESVGCRCSCSCRCRRIAAGDGGGWTWPVTRDTTRPRITFDERPIFYAWPRFTEDHRSGKRECFHRFSIHPFLPFEGHWNNNKKRKTEELITSQAYDRFPSKESNLHLSDLFLEYISSNFFSQISRKIDTIESQTGRFEFPNKLAITRRNAPDQIFHPHLRRHEIWEAQKKHRKLLFTDAPPRPPTVEKLVLPSTRFQQCESRHSRLDLIGGRARSAKERTSSFPSFRRVRVPRKNAPQSRGDETPLFVHAARVRLFTKHKMEEGEVRW